MANVWQDLISLEWGVGAHELMISNFSITLGIIAIEIAQAIVSQKEALDSLAKVVFIR